MNDAFEEGCSEDHAGDLCPICQCGELNPDFLARIERAASQPGHVMTGDEFKAWLDSL